VTKSANDVATALAEKLSGTERKFAKRMTRKAKALGMRRTGFHERIWPAKPSAEINSA
jgi:D-alanyl-D-alanine carboxypeptidase